MEEDRSRIGSLFRLLRQAINRQLIAEVPEDFALCEFDCRKRQCIQGEWEACERRIHKAAGELFPNPPPESS